MICDFEYLFVSIRMMLIKYWFKMEYALDLCQL